MKRKIFITVVAFFTAVYLNSCLDAIEYITVDKNGDIKLSFMITISRSLVEMGSEGESVEDTFKEDVIDPSEISSMIPGAKDAEARLIDSDVDYGYLFTFTLPRNYQPADDVPMAPRINWNSIEILMALPAADAADENAEGSAETPAEMDEMAAAIFSSAKYKVMISTRLMPHADKAYIRSESGEIIDLDLVDLGDSYLVNLPMLMVMEPENKMHLVFEF